MQNNSANTNSGAFRKFFQEKGYYIVLFLCITAIGISGYLFVSNAISEKNSLNEETLSVATETHVPTKTDPAQTQEPAAQEKEEPAQQTAAVFGDDAVREAASSIRIWPVSGAAITPYSMEQLRYNETTRDWRTHDGMDLSAVSGEPVQAAGSGTVSKVYDDETLGMTVVISHAGGYQTHYSNLAAVPTVSVGDKVAAGDVIGAVGQTALIETGAEPHLHFAVSLDGASVNPMDYLD